MKFETILDAYGKACIWCELLDDTKLYMSSQDRNIRQRDAFRARLIKMFYQVNELEEDVKYWRQMYNQSILIFLEQLQKLCEILDVPYRKTSFEKALKLVQELSDKATKVE